MKAQSGSRVQRPRRLQGAGVFTPRTKAAYVVGITRDGYVPVVEDDDAETGGTVVGLPALALGEPPSRGFEVLRDRVVGALRREFGYEARELVPMGSSSTSIFLLAPMLGVAGWRVRSGFVPGVYEVALGALPAWLRQRRLAGAAEAPPLRRGLLLAQDAFPRWARDRLTRAIAEIDRKRTAGAAAIA